jgi:hypothetical protein
MRLARPTVVMVVFAATLAAGCGSSGDSSPSTGNPSPSTVTAPPGAAARSCEGVAAGAGELRVTGVGCDVGRGVVAAWVNEGACSHPASASRHTCTAGGYRCHGARTDRGVAVSCARPGHSIAFVARRGS